MLEELRTDGRVATHARERKAHNLGDRTGQRHPESDVHGDWGTSPRRAVPSEAMQGMASRDLLRKKADSLQSQSQWLCAEGFAQGRSPSSWRQRIAEKTSEWGEQVWLLAFDLSDVGIWRVLYRRLGVVAARAMMKLIM